MTLGEYLSSQRISQRDFGKPLNLTQGYVSHVVVGRHKPRGFMAVKIATATGFVVTPHDLNPTDYPNPNDGLPPEQYLTNLTQILSNV